MLYTGHHALTLHGALLHLQTSMISRLRQRARQIKADTYALYLACRHPATPWYVKLLGVCVVAYALSPIDLIPDFIPVLGYLDDLLLVPAGLAIMMRLIPPAVLAECRASASESLAGAKPVSWVAGAVVVTIWIALALGVVWLIIRAFGQG